MTACEYLNAVEGPIWRGVRGAGYAYGASVYMALDSGVLKLDVYRGADTGKALKACEEMIRDFASGKTPIEEHMLEGAKNMVAHNAAYERQNASTSAACNYIDYAMKGRPRDYLKQYLASVSNDVTAESIRSTMKKYFLPLFDSNTSMVFVACHASMTDDLVKKFTEEGYDVEVAGITGGGEDEEGKEEDDEEGSEAESHEDEDEDDEEE